MFLSLLAAVLVAGVGCQSFDDVNDRLDRDEQSLLDIRERLAAVEEAIGQINSDITTLSAIRGGVVIYRVTGSETDGWTLTLSNGLTLQIPARPATFGNAPVVSVDDEGYWTVDYGQGPVYVLDITGDKVSSIGRGADGKPGSDGLSPTLGLDADGYWKISFDGGQTWEYVLDAAGERIAAVVEVGDSIFDGVSSAGNTVTVTLKNGLSLPMPLVEDFLCAIEGAGTTQTVPEGGTRSFAVQMRGVLSAVVTCPNGWTASLEDGTLTVGAPVTTKAYFSTETSVAIFAVSTAGYSTISRMDVQAGKLVDDDILSQIKAYSAVDASYSLENEWVSKYLTEVTYTDADWSESRVMDYVSAATGYNSAHPVTPIALNWTAGSANALFVLMDESGETSITELGVGTGSYSLSNLIPGRTYKYGIVDYATDSQTLLKRGAFATTGSLRMINTSAIDNVRDLGGWAGLDGKHIVYGLIYRGGQFDAWSSGVCTKTLSTLDKKLFVDGLGVVSDVDLRSAAESGNATASPLGVRYGRYSVTQYYSGLVDAMSQALYLSALKEILSCVKAGTPVYFHCMAGADRTGTVAMLLEGLLGVSESDIAKDYELTSFYAERRRNNYPVSGIKYLKGLGTDLNDGIYNYCTKVLGLGAAEIEEFRTIMLK